MQHSIKHAYSPLPGVVYFVGTSAYQHGDVLMFTDAEFKAEKRNHALETWPLTPEIIASRVVPPEDTTPRLYAVLPGRHMHLGDRHYVGGSVVSLSPKEAAQRAGAIEEYPLPPEVVEARKPVPEDLTTRPYRLLRDVVIKDERHIAGTIFHLTAKEAIDPYGIGIRCDPVLESSPIAAVVAAATQVAKAITGRAKAA